MVVAPVAVGMLLDLAANFDFCRLVEIEPFGLVWSQPLRAVLWIGVDDLPRRECAGRVDGYPRALVCVVGQEHFIEIVLLPDTLRQAWELERER